MTTQKHSPLTPIELDQELVILEMSFINEMIAVINPRGTTTKEYEYIDKMYYSYMQELHDTVGLDDGETLKYARRMLDRFYVYKEQEATIMELSELKNKVWNLERKISYYQRTYGNQ